ncbi:peptide deformylase [bacterium]|nr:peptide deformylase [bacterium]
MKIKVLKYPDDSLKRKADIVMGIDEPLIRKIDELVELMYSSRGIGLAANQAGFKESIFVMDCSEDKDEPMCFINPKIISGTGESYLEERCLSFPGVAIQVQRFKKVVIEFMDINGNTLKKTLKDMESICAQHEIDHLEGKTFLERVNRKNRRSAQKALKKNKGEK